MTMDLTALSRITDVLIDKWEAAADKLSQAYLRITDANILNWENAASKAHSHYNKAFLDSLNEASIRTYVGSGETNQGISLGGGQAIYYGKSGEVLTFRSITAGSGITLSGSSSEISVSAAAGTAGHNYEYTFLAISAGTTYRGTLYAVNTIVERKKVGYVNTNASFSGNTININGTNELFYETQYKANQPVTPNHTSESLITFTPYSTSWGVLTIQIWREA